MERHWLSLPSTNIQVQFDIVLLLYLSATMTQTDTNFQLTSPRYYKNPSADPDSSSPQKLKTNIRKKVTAPFCHIDLNNKIFVCIETATDCPSHPAKSNFSNNSSRSSSPISSTEQPNPKSLSGIFVTGDG
jgi:hypothetical protein